MNFQEAMLAVRQGKKVGSVSVLGDEGGYLELHDGSVAICFDGDYESDLAIDAGVLDATDYYEIPEVVEPATLTAYFDRAKGRWVSTTNPERHRASGAEVKVFVAQG